MRKTYIDAGEIVTTHGVRGEVKVLPWLDSPQMLCQFERCRIDGREVGIKSCRVQKTCNIVKFCGIDTMEDAQAMRGKTVEVYREDIDDAVIFAAELIDMEVFCDGRNIGKITDVLDYPGNAVYVINGGEYMIPAVKEFILRTDMDINEMYVKIIEGMGRDEN